jgi:hypothetical protein
MCNKWSPSASLTVRLEKRWTDCDEIWYLHYAILGYPRLIPFEAFAAVEMGIVVFFSF